MDCKEDSEICSSSRRNVTSWLEQQGPQVAGNSPTAQITGSPAPFSRPAITTGAALPWRGKVQPSLGPPRAIQSSTSVFPTITVATSSGQYGAKVMMTNLPPSPFSWPNKKPYEELKSAGLPDPSNKHPIHFEDGVRDDGNETTAELEMQPKQNSIHSIDSVHSQERRLLLSPIRAGHTITTAQNAKGSNRLTSCISEPSWPFERMNTAVSKPDCGRMVGGVTVTTAGFAASLGRAPISNTAVTTGQPLTYESDGGLEDSSAPRREGLRSASKRRPGLSFDLDSKDSSEAALNSELELGQCSTEDEERRRVRRRMNNLKCARRVREKRDEDLREVHAKVARLEEEQSKLMRHCELVDRNCHSLRRELQDLQRRWGNISQENKRLQHELHYLRCNSGFNEGPKTYNHVGLDKSTTAIMPTQAEIAADLQLDEKAFIKGEIGRSPSQIWAVW